MYKKIQALRMQFYTCKYLRLIEVIQKQDEYKNSIVLGRQFKNLISTYKYDRVNISIERP